MPAFATKGSMLLVSCLVILLVNAVAAVPNEVSIGLLVPTSASSTRTIWAVEAAIDHARSLLPGTNIRLLVNDSGTTSDQCNSMMVWQYNSGCVAVLGTTSSTLTVPMSPVATGFRRPLISWSAGSSLLTSRTDNPYFLRTIPSDDRIGDAFFAICKKFGWTRMALLFTNDARGTSLADAMRSRVPDELTLTRQSFRVGSQTSMRSALSVIASLGHTVIGLHGAQGDLTAVLEMAAELGMVGKGYTWLGSTWTGSAYPTVYKGKQFMGVIGAAVAVEDTAEAQAFRNEMVTLHPTTSQAEWTVRDAGVYDAATAVVRGLQTLFASPQLQALGDGPGLMQALNNYVDFAGASGRVKFTADGDILTHMDIMTIGADGQWKTVGEYQPGTNSTGGLLTLDSPIIFGDGTTEPSKDYIVVYEEGESLPVSYDDQSLLLAFALGLVGTWSALIFVEQAISTYRATVQRINSGETGDDEEGCRGCGKRFFSRYEHFFWLVCAAIAVGGVGVTCLSYIAFTSIQLPAESHGLQLSMSSAGASFPVTIGWLFVALLCELKNSNSTQTATNNKTKPYLLKETANKDKKKSLNGSVARTVAELKLAVSQLSRWTLLFILFTSLGIVGSHYMVASGLSAGQAKLQMEGLALLGACIVCVVFVSLASVLFFHVLKSRVRLFAAPLMTVAIFVSQYLVMKGCKFLFHPHDSEEEHEHEDGGLDVGRLQAITSIIGFAFCFLFIGVQVTRLKLSRGTLDRLLEQCQDQLHRLEAQVAEEKNDKRRAQIEADESKNMLEMINFVRPLLRNHAFAHAMADRKGSSLAANAAKADEGERDQGSVSIWALGLASAKNERTVASLLSELNAMPNLHSGPVHARAIADVKLTELLSHPVTLEIIKDTVMKSLAPESVALLLDVQRFRSVDKASLRLSLAQELLACYVAADAPYQVNISSTMRGQLQNAVRTGHVTGGMFDELEAEMLKLISTNTMDTFYSSSAFKFCCMLLDHPSYRLKTVVKRGGNLSGVGNSDSSSNRSNNHPRVPGQMEASRGSRGSRGSRFDSRDLPTPSKNNKGATSLAAPGSRPSIPGKRLALQNSPGMGGSGRTLGPDNEPPSPNPVSAAWGTDRTMRSVDTPDLPEHSKQGRDDSPVQAFPATGTATAVSTTRRLLSQKLQDAGSSNNLNGPTAGKVVSDSSSTDHLNDVIIPVQADEHDSLVGSPRLSDANISIMSEM